MDLILYLLAAAVSGLIVGALARLALPGRDPLTLLQTILVGVAGSLAAGVVSYYLFDGRAGGLLLSVAIATLIVYLIRRSRGGTLTQAAPREGLDRGEHAGEPTRRSLFRR